MAYSLFIYFTNESYLPVSNWKLIKILFLKKKKQEEERFAKLLRSHVCICLCVDTWTKRITIRPI